MREVTLPLLSRYPMCEVLHGEQLPSGIFDIRLGLVRRVLAKLLELTQEEP